MTLSVPASDWALQAAPKSVQIITPSQVFNPVHVLSLNQVLVVLKKSGTKKQFFEMQPDELEAVLVAQGMQVFHGDTKAIAAANYTKHQTVLKHVSQRGSFYGLRATKLPSRKLDLNRPGFCGGSNS